SRQREQRDGGDGERRVDAWARARLPGPDGEAEQVAQDEGRAHERQRRGHRIAEQRAHGAPGGDAPAPVPANKPAEPDRILRGEGPVEAKDAALDRELRRGRGRDRKSTRLNSSHVSI